MAQQKTFSYKEALKFGLSGYIDNFWVFLQASLIYALLIPAIVVVSAGIPWLAYTLVRSSAGHEAPFFLTVLYVIFITFIASLAMAYMGANFTKVSFAIYNGKHVTLKDFFQVPFNIYFRYFVATLLYALKVALCFFLLIIPGLYLWIKYAFTGYFILEEQSSISEDQELNRKLTQGARWQLFWFNILLYVLESFCSLGLITMIFAPVFILAHTHVYKQLRSSNTVDEVKDALLGR